MDLRGCNQITDFEAVAQISVVNGVNFVGRYTILFLCFLAFSRKPGRVASLSCRI